MAEDDINARMVRGLKAVKSGQAEDLGQPLLSICRECQADISRSCLVGFIKLPTMVSGPPTIHEHRVVPGALLPAEATVLVLLRPQRCPECGAPILYESQLGPVRKSPPAQ